MTAPDSGAPGAGFDTDVAIVGYGPSGVSAANFLGAYGVKAIAFEREEGIYPRARAVTVNDWTLRCFQSVGLDAALLRDMDPTYGLRWLTYAGKELLRVKFDPSTMGQPISSMIYQPVMEQTLRDGAARYADRIEVRFGKEVTRVDQDAEGVTITTTDAATGAVESTRARYALACDGGASGVRGQLGLKLIGSTIDTKWVVIDARVKRWWPERHLNNFWADAKRPVVDIPLALGNHRWEFPLEPHESEKDFSTQEQLWPLLAAMNVTPEHVEIHQHAFYKHHVRHAERWRVGRIFLLGDAAHMMPPWAGQGMQSGIRDAFNIAWKLREVLAGRLPDTLLDSYEAERAPNVAMVTGVSERMGRIIKRQMTGKEKMLTLLGGIMARLGMPMPPSPLALPPTLDAGWLRGAVGPSSPVGKMIPQPAVSMSNGKRSPLDEVLGHGFVLLGDETDPAALLTPSEKAAWDSLGTRYLAVRSVDRATTAASDVVDLDGTLLAWLRTHRTRAIALRPDRFVAAADGSGLGVPGPLGSGRIAVASAGAPVPAATRTPALSGDSRWAVVIKTPMGENEVRFDLHIEGGVVTGAVVSPKESSPIREGVADGHALNWRAKVSTPVSMELTFTATVDGDTITGGAKSPFGTAPFSGHATKARDERTVPA